MNLSESAVGTTRRLRSSAALVLTGLVMAKLSGAAGGVVSARLLGPADRGSYALWFTLGVSVGTALTAGIDLWVGRQVGAGHLRIEVERVVSRHLRRILGAFLALAAVAATVVALTGGDPALVLSSAFVAATTAVFTVVAAIIAAEGRTRSYAVANLTSGGVYLSAALVLLALDLPVVWLLLAAAGIAKLIASSLLGGGRYLRAVSSDRAGTRAAHRRALRFAAPAGLGTMLELAVYRIDIAMLALLADTRAVGLYVTAVALSELLWLAPNAMAYVILPSVARRTAGTATAQAVRVSTLFTSLGGLALIAFSRPLIAALFGSEFTEAAGAVPALVAAAILLGTWKILTADLLARGHSAARVATAASGVVVMVLLDILLVPERGIVGAAIASAGGYFVAAGLAALMWSRAGAGRARDLVRFQFGDLLAVRPRRAAPSGDAAR